MSRLSALLHRNMVPSIGRRGRIASVFCCGAAKVCFRPASGVAYTCASTLCRTVCPTG